MATGHTPCGIAIPQTFPRTPVNMQLVRDFLQKAETLGYEGLWVQEQILGDYPILEPVSLLTYAAALTSKLRLGTSVLLTVLRNPVQLAKSLSSLDQMSQGRLTVGVGIGGHVPESLFGLSSEQRARRFVEGLQVMKALWTQPRATVAGTFWQFENVPMEPKPVQKPHPPLWFGAREEVALRRAVRHGDGWMGAGVSSTADFIKQVGLVRRLLDEAQRDPATFPISKRVFLSVHQSPEVAQAEVRRWFSEVYYNPALTTEAGVYGTPEQVRKGLEELVGMGASHLLLNPVARYTEQLETLADVVGLS